MNGIGSPRVIASEMIFNIRSGSEGCSRLNVQVLKDCSTLSGAAALGVGAFADRFFADRPNPAPAMPSGLNTRVSDQACTGIAAIRPLRKRHRCRCAGTQHTMI